MMKTASEIHERQAQQYLMALHLATSTPESEHHLSIADAEKLAAQYCTEGQIQLFRESAPDVAKPWLDAALGRLRAVSEMGK